MLIRRHDLGCEIGPPENIAVSHKGLCPSMWCRSPGIRQPIDAQTRCLGVRPPQVSVGGNTVSSPGRPIRPLSDVTRAGHWPFPVASVEQRLAVGAHVPEGLAVVAGSGLAEAPVLI